MCMARVGVICEAMTVRNESCAIVAADEYRCDECGSSIFMRLNAPIALDYQSSYKEWQERATLRFYPPRPRPTQVTA